MYTCIAEPMVMAEVSVGGAADVSINSLQPHPLPMPAYGGYYAPLSQYLPTAGTLPSPPYQRYIARSNFYFCARLLVLAMFGV